MPPHPDAVKAAEVTGHRRFLDLCDPDHADFNPAYLGLVARIAAGEPWPPPARPKPAPAPAPAGPSLLARARNFAGAVASHVSAGLPTLDAAAVAARLAVCQGCDQRKAGGTCAGCGCNLRLKASWADQDCPLGRWPRALPADAAAALAAVRAGPWEDLAWLRRWALAGPDPLADVRRYAETPAPGPRDPPVHLWLHVATIGAWRPILRELLSAVERSGLRAAAGRVYAGVVGPEADLSWLPPWVTVVRRDGPLGLGENSTLQALWDWSKSATPGKVCYLHTKGASHGEANPNVVAWRDYLTYFTVLRWREAAAALDGPYDCCGCDWTARDDPWFIKVGSWVGPGMDSGYGFEGNFWWARTGYLASLPPARVVLDRTRWDAEWAFVGAGFPRALELHGPHLNLYANHYPRSRYDPGAG